MKSRVLALAVGLIAVSAGSALAQAPAGSALVTAGMADVWFGWRSVESTQDPNGEDLSLGANGFVSVPVGSAISIQLDAQYERYVDDDSYSPLGALLLGGHASWRNPERFLVGAFAAAALPQGDQIDNDSPGFYSGWGYIAGAEAQVYLNDFTLYVQGGLGDIRTDFDSGPEGFVNGWFVRALGRYFITDNFMLQAEYSYGTTDCFIDGACAPAEDAGVFHNWGVLAKFLIAGDLYGTLEYVGGSYEATEDPDLGTEHVVRAGISVLFGAESLRHNDRYGATLSLPLVGVRGAAWAEPLD